MATRKIHHPERGDADAAGALRTPLVRVDGAWVKLEYLNPSGSVKDRVASHVLQNGLRRGSLRPGNEVVEPTSGNAGIALAYWAKRLGLRAVVFMPENMTEERKTIIRGHGAQLVLTPEPEGVVGAIRRARAYANERPDRFLFDQFDDEAGGDAQAALGREAAPPAPDQGSPRVHPGVPGRPARRRRPGPPDLLPRPDGPLPQPAGIQGHLTGGTLDASRPSPCPVLRLRHHPVVRGAALCRPGSARAAGRMEAPGRIRPTRDA